MVLGRLTHYAFDALAISTVLAGIKKQTGFAPATEQIPDSSIRTFANAYFGTGETLFNIISGTVVSSSYFEQKLQGTGPVYGERKTGL